MGKVLSICIISFLLWASDSASAPRITGFGIDALPASSSRFPCIRALRSIRHIRSNPTFQLLYGSFGRSLSCGTRFIRQHRRHPHTLIIHGLNATCTRSGRRCPKGEKMSPRAFERRVRRILKSISSHVVPHSRVILMLALEDGWTYRRYLAYRKAAAKHWPYELGRNSIVSTRVYPGDIREHHGTDCKGADVCSLDGISAATSPSVCKASLPLHKVNTWIRLNYGRRLILFWRCNWQGAFGRQFIPYEIRPLEFTAADEAFVLEAYRYAIRRKKRS